MARQRIGAKQLSDREQVFVRAYLASFSVKAAAEEAGVKQGADILRRPHVRAEVRKKLSERFAAHDITAERVLKELASIAFANVSDAMALSTDGDGAQMLRILDTDMWPRELHAAVSAIEQTLDGEIKLKTRDKLKALEMLAKHLHLLGDDDQKKDQVHIVVVPERATTEDGWQERAVETREQSERRMEETLGKGSSKQ